MLVDTRETLDRTQKTSLSIHHAVIDGLQKGLGMGPGNGLELCNQF